MKDLRNKILPAISKGLNESLNYIEDLDDEDDFTLSKKSISQAIKDTNNFKDFYSKKLLDMLYSPKKIDKDFIKKAKVWHKQCGAQYNPHLDGHDFSEFIDTCIEIMGNNVNLNWIDTSSVTDMSSLFSNSEFNGGISEWDVSHVKDMKFMFAWSKFTGDISSWNVSNVTNMQNMFEHTLFNGNLSNWDVSHVTNMEAMFLECRFNRDISKWNVSNVINMKQMFCKSGFNGDISSWDVSHVYNMDAMFRYSCYKGNAFEVWKPATILKKITQHDGYAI